MRAGIHVPAEHQSAGITNDYPPVGDLMKHIIIASSESRPKSPSPAVRYRDYWYFVRDSDQSSKAAFAAVRAMWATCIEGTTEVGQAPVLTIPVNN